MKNLKIIMNGPLFFQLLVYAVFIAMNLLQFDEVNEHEIFLIYSLSMRFANQQLFPQFSVSFQKTKISIHRP